MLTFLDDPYPHWCFTAPSGDLLRVVPDRGGLITGWLCSGRERLYFDEERFADPARSVRGGVPILFPVCGNLPKNELVLPQGVYVLPQHGFARDRPWSLQPLADGQGVCLDLHDDEVTRAIFPFSFAVRLEVRLEPAALGFRVSVRHNSPTAAIAPEAVMPFAFGLHPYFSVADLGAAGLEGLPSLGFDHLTGAMATTADQLQRLPQGVDLRFDRQDDPAMSFLPALVTEPAGAAVKLFAEPPFNHAVVWTDPPRPMVCLEPWSAPRGELGLRLAPGQRQELACRYGVVGG